MATAVDQRAIERFDARDDRHDGLAVTLTAHDERIKHLGVGLSIVADAEPRLSARSGYSAFDSRVQADRRMQLEVFVVFLNILQHRSARWGIRRCSP